MKWSSLLAIVLFCLLNGIQCGGPAKPKGCKPLHGVTYDLFARNTKDICLSKEQVIIDVQIMATFTKSIRLYNSAVCPDSTKAFFSEAKNQKLTVLMGIYIGPNAKDNEKELKMMKTIMKSYSSIVSAVVVGSDAIVSGKIGSTSRYAKISNNVELLIEYIGRVKKTMRSHKWNHPVTTAEGWGVWESEHGPDLIEFSIDINPFDEGIQVECTKRDRRNCIGAAAYANARATGLSKFYSKDVWVCETGWPTSGEKCCFGIPNKKFGFRAVPSYASASTYLNGFVKGAGSRPYFISSAFDRDWRRVWSPCPRCTERNLARSSFKNGICDLCDHQYTMGIFDEKRERKSDYEIPKVKCKVPGLPTTRLAPVTSKSKPSTKAPKPSTKTSKETPKKAPKTSKVVKTKDESKSKSKSKSVEDSKSKSTSKSKKSEDSKSNVRSKKLDDPKLESKKFSKSKGVPKDVKKKGKGKA